MLDSVQRDLDAMPEAIRVSPYAALALRIAEDLDDPETSAATAAQLTKNMIDALDRLRSRTPAGEERDGLDDLGARRAARLAKRGSRRS